MNDLWDRLTIRNDKFALIAEMNKMVDMIVKTSVGDAEIFSNKFILVGPTQRGKTTLLDGWVAGKSKNISNSEG